MKAEQEDVPVIASGRRVGRSLGLGPMERSRSLSARAADRIVDRILELDLRPGDRLPSERVLCLEMDSSRTVIREAVKSLIGRGIVQARHGQGLFVAAPSGSATRASVNLLLNGDVELRYDKVRVIRDLLEVDAAGRAATNASAEDIEAMERALALQARATAQHDVDGAAHADVEFHLALARATQNELFPFLLDAMGDVMLAIRITTMQVPGDFEEGIESHSRIVAAVRARDPVRARKAMRTHLVHSERAMSTAGESSDPVRDRDPETDTGPGAEEPGVDPEVPTG
ncbi:MAG: FadR family transcriptional regulator [Chloroflexi bacterium]|nr:FadR family transcriptional regulator [Chloroflexota bacterium]